MPTLRRGWVSPDPLLAKLGVRHLQIGGDWWNRCNEGWLNIDPAFKQEGMSASQYGTDDKNAHNMVLSFNGESVLPFADNSVQMVYCEHMIEHMLPSDGGINLLHEAYRVLAPGGVLRVATPDLAKYLCGYVKPPGGDRRQEGFLRGHAFRFEPMERMLGRQVPPSEASIVNNIFRNYGHKWVYDFAELMRAAQAAGVPVQHVCRSNRLARGLPVQLQRALRRAKKPSNMSLSCWLDQEVREDESVYVHFYKDPHAPWPHANRTRREPAPFCTPFQGTGSWFSCPASVAERTARV